MKFLRGLPWLWINLGACGCWVLYVIFVGGPAQKAGCLENLRKVLLGAQIYALDHDDRLPLKQSWASATHPYVESRDDFNCAVASAGEPERFGHAFYSLASGLSLDEAQRLDVPIFFDSRDMGWGAYGDLNQVPESPRHGDADAVAYLSGVVLVPRKAR